MIERGGPGESASPAAVALVPVWRKSDDELVEELRADHIAQARRDAARLAMLRELDARRYAASRAFTSTAAWLSHELLIDRPVAAAEVQAARQLDPDGDVPSAPGAMMPTPARGEVALAATGRALAGGSISRAHAAAVLSSVQAVTAPEGASIAELAHQRTTAETLLLAECARLTPTQVRRCGKRIQHHLDPDGVLASERTATARARFWITYDSDTTAYRFGGTTDAVTGAQLTTLIDAHAKPRPGLDPDTGVREQDPRLPEQRRAHAFADLIRLAANADDTTSGGLSTHLLVTTTLQTLQSRLAERGIACADTETGAPLSAAAIRLLACDTTVIPMILGTSSEPLDVGRSTRTIPLATRRALVARDKQCAFPGCDRPPRWADGHHIQHWADGGPTSLDNLVLLCGHHHDVIHHTDWTVTIHDGRPVFRAPPDRSTSRLRGPPHPQRPARVSSGGRRG